MPKITRKQLKQLARSEHLIVRSQAYLTLRLRAQAQESEARLQQLLVEKQVTLESPTE
jgi:hypothetical protein